MDDILHKIIGFEKIAQGIVGEARNERQAYEETVKTEVGSYRDAVMSENRARIEDYASQMKREAGEAIKHLDDAAKLRITQMQMSANANKNVWIEYLLKKIISGEIR